MKKLLVPVIAVLAAFTLAACGGSPKPSSSSSTGPQSGVEGSASASASASSGSSAGSSHQTANPGGSAASSKALQAVVQAAQTTLNQQKSTWSSEFSNVTLTGEGSSTLVLTYTFIRDADATKAGSGISAQRATLQQGFDQSLFPMLKLAGITNPAIKVVWKSPTGATVSDMTFTASK